MGEQYDRFSTVENFELAYIRLKTKKRDEYKNFFYEDFRVFEYGFEDNIKQLCKDVREDIYEPQSPERYYMPKKKHLVRPITLLSLPDQIIYQALANVIADELYDIMSPFFNSSIFGNIFRNTQPPKGESNIFFFEKWNKQWKRFNDEIRTKYKKGYKYIVKFDIASYYDMIDHNILCQILENYNVEDKLIDLLKKCLRKWALPATSHFKNYQKSCGIPQGPISSPFFAEIYLSPLDKLMRNYRGVYYFRYADDINIMAKTEAEGNEKIILLDLVIRDLALVPQSEKVTVELIENIDQHINSIARGFSKISQEYKKNNSIREKNHNKLKKRFQQCIEENILDKTLIKFSLFKFNKDPEIKQIIMEHIGVFELFFEGITYYFNKHYPNDEEIIKWATSYLIDKKTYKYNKSQLFANYKSMPFNEDVFCENFKAEDNFWILNYFVIDWLKNNDEIALIKSTYSTNENYFIKRKYIAIESAVNDRIAKKIFLQGIMHLYATNSCNSIMLSLHAYYLWNNYFPFENIIANAGESGDFNRYIAIHLVANTEDDYFLFNMNKLYGLKVPKNFMDKLKNNNDRYIELSKALKLFIDQKHLDADKSLLNIDLVHNIFLDVLGEDKGSSDSGFKNLLTYKNQYPIMVPVFSQIHKLRSERTSAHYKTKKNEIHKRITLLDYNACLDKIDLASAYKDIFEKYGFLEND